MNSSGQKFNLHQGYEAPACVQNAMMTKEKKPFTYTPGGIDLSQIKSERMAKRLARNAQAEGVSHINQQNRPVHPLSPGNASDAMASVGAAALGMPFQVLPPSPSQQPINVGKKTNDNVSVVLPGPPPPPPPPSAHNANTLAPPSNGIMKSGLDSPRTTRKSPTPQRFEPPPMGFRPEIKIPPNPMANLRKVPPPVEKNTFWKDEYAKERSKSPIPERDHRSESITNSSSPINDKSSNNGELPIPNNIEDGALNNKHVRQIPFNSEGKKPSQLQNNYDSTNFKSPQVPENEIFNNVTHNSQEKKQQPMLSSELSNNVAEKSPPIVSQVDRSPVRPLTPQHVIDSPVRVSEPKVPIQPEVKPIVLKDTTPQAQTVPWRTAKKPMPQPVCNDANEQMQQTTGNPYYPNAYNGNTKPTNVGSLYIAPLTPAQNRDNSVNQEQNLQNQPQLLSQPAPWMTTQVKKDQPDWAHANNNSNVISAPRMHQYRTPPVNNNNNNNNNNNILYQTPNEQHFEPQRKATTGLRLQINPPIINNPPANQNFPKERIIPIQLEQSPAYNPVQPNFTNQTFNPGMSNIDSASYVIRSPNQFVDQGYNNYFSTIPHQQINNSMVTQSSQNRVTQQVTSNTRIIPISIEGETTPRTTSQSPVTYPNNCRSPPVQSKSFRILQKMTDMVDNVNLNKSNEDETAESQLQRPQFSKQMSIQQARNSPTIEQVKQMHNKQMMNQQNLRNNSPQNGQQIHPGNAVPPNYSIKPAMTPENAAETDYSDNFEFNENQKNYADKNMNSSLYSNAPLPPQPQPPPPPLPPLQCTPIMYTPMLPFYLDHPNSYHCSFNPFPYQNLWFPQPQPIQNGNDQTAIEYNDKTSYCHYPYHLTPQSIDNQQNQNINENTCKYCNPKNYFYPHYHYPVSFQMHEHDTSPNRFDPSCIPFNSYCQYPISHNCSQSSNSSTTNSCSLPDIIVTPSADEIPSKLKLCREMLNEMENTSLSEKFQSNDKQNIEYTRNISNHIDQKELNLNINKTNINNTTTTSSKIPFTTENEICKTEITNCESQSDNSLCNDIDVDYLVESASEMENLEEDSYSESESDSDITPKCEDRMKSVSNVHMYYLKDISENSSGEEDSLILDDGEIVDEMENSNSLIDDESLSIIYEESEMENHGSQKKLNTIDQEDNSTGYQINNDYVSDDEMENSVTVRLPLKLSFSRSVNDENITTVEVGDSHIENINNLCNSVSDKILSENNSDNQNISTDQEDVEKIDLPHKNSYFSNHNNLPNVKHKNTADCVEKPQVNESVNETKELLVLKDTNEMDFLETVRAMKLQTQKLMEQSTNYWGKSKQTENNNEFLKPSTPILNNIFINTDSDSTGIIEYQTEIKQNQEQEVSFLEQNLPIGEEIISSSPDNSVSHSILNLSKSEEKEEEEKEEEEDEEEDDEEDDDEEEDDDDDDDEDNDETTESEVLNDDLEINTYNSSVPKDKENITNPNYPEEPREVDTDEEIDFWAEIEASRNEKESSFNWNLPAIQSPFSERNNNVQSQFFSRNIYSTDSDLKEVIEPEEPSIDSKIFDQTHTSTIKNENSINHISHLNTLVEERIAVPCTNENESTTKQCSSLNTLLEERFSDINQDTIATVFCNTSIDDQSKSNRNREFKDDCTVEKLEITHLTPPINLFATPENCNHIYVEKNCNTINKSTIEETPKKPENKLQKSIESLSSKLPDLNVENIMEPKISVRDRISAFESGPQITKSNVKQQELEVEKRRSTFLLNRLQRSESEIEEEDSGVTDMNKQFSGTDTESESFPELRKMTSYQRAATHSRLFKLLQDDNDVADDDMCKVDEKIDDELRLRPSRQKIIHNVSITRKQNPNAIAKAETMLQRRERLSLPLQKNSSIDADNPSTPNSPASPILGCSSSSNGFVSDKLVNELVQSLLLKRDSTHLRQLPMEKLQAAAKRVLEEELNSLDNTSLDSTPVLTPTDTNTIKSYDDYYNTWSDSNVNPGFLPSKAFISLQEGLRRNSWTVRCPRVLSSKTINSDLARVTESPEISLGTNNNQEYLKQPRDNIYRRRKQ